MMVHEDGYCDRCGCQVAEAQLTADGGAVCMTCAMEPPLARPRKPAKPEARDDGR